MAYPTGGVIQIRSSAVMGRCNIIGRREELALSIKILCHDQAIDAKVAAIARTELAGL